MPTIVSKEVAKLFTFSRVSLSVNKLAIVQGIGTWSVDVLIIDKDSTWETRVAKGKLEVIACK